MRIKNSLVSCEIKEIKPKIFAVIIKDDYDRGMLFCRYQEFYESPFKEIRGNFFTLEEFMKLYIKKNKKDSFTYTKDWAGYNIPSNILYSAMDIFGNSKNMYDNIMREIVYYCEKQTNGKSFYLIGVDKLKSTTMSHEIAHGLYYTNNEYKISVDTLISEIPKNEYNHIKKELIKIGYTNDKKIIDDEIQAFLSTGMFKEIKTPSIVLRSKKFTKNFKSFI